MGDYNLKIYDYKNFYHVRVYNTVMHSTDKVDSVVDLVSFDDSFSSLSDDTNKDVNKERSLYVSKNRTIQSIYEITRSNTWSYFLTITFNPKLIDRTDYDLVSSKTSKWINNLKNRYAPDLKYIIIPELHKDGKSYHFHALLSNIGNMRLVFSGHYTKSKLPIFNLDNWKLGFSTVTKIKDSARASAYISKYITKELCATTKFKRRYWASRNCEKPIVNTFCVDLDDLENILDSRSDYVQYVKSVRNEDSGIEVIYVEMDKEKLDSNNMGFDSSFFF